MSSQVQYRRGTTAQHASFTGALGEVTVDTDKKTLVVHDGETAGGFPVPAAIGAGYFNVNPMKFSRWSAALARHRAGSASARIACIGDSTTSGVGSNPASATTDSRRRAYPSVLAAALTATQGVKAQANSIWCDGFEGANIVAFDPRLTLGASWQTHPSLFCAGGRAFWDAPAASSTPMRFAPGTQTDTLDVYFIRYPGYADFIATDGGSYNGNQSTSDAAGVAKATFTRTLSSNYWEVQKSDLTLGADLLIVGLDAYNSAEKPVSVWNMGASGSRVSHWTADNQPYSFVNAIQTFAPDLSIVNLTINDWSNSTSPDAYRENLAAIVNACAVTGDVLLVIGVPSNEGAAPQSRQDEYTGYVYALAREKDLPVINLTERWVSQSYRPERGFYFDGQHPSNIGYQDVGYAVAKLIGNP